MKLKNITSSASICQIDFHQDCSEYNNNSREPMSSSSTHVFCFAVIEWQILHAVPLKYYLGLTSAKVLGQSASLTHFLITFKGTFIAFDAICLIV